MQSNRILGVKRKIPLMLSDSSSAHSVPKYGRQYSLEHVHGPGPYSAPSPAYSSSSLYSSDAVTSSGPIISDITELAPTSPLASPGRSIDERPLSSSTLVRVKEEPPAHLIALGYWRQALGAQPPWIPLCPQLPSLTPSFERANLPLLPQTQPLWTQPEPKPLHPQPLHP